ncbi:CaiB/BaiF CoA transferase family protein [Cumulibacter manganitolerans]|uniref:CaiB/BaiF CoA transferase family protein n=1 Tax=Cumulibacter manganitolerans TaxID=1884992 RepID=UPI0012960C7C|nr:CaiB/BaiF CoA-transferase family protein [Cumulibacter manganitolerans]
MRPLDGVTVVALEQAVAAPFATRQLADLGARVIKVERPEVGDFARGYDETVRGLSSHFVWLNRSKESVALDIKDAGDRALLDALVERADIVIQNLAPGAVGRLGLDAATLRARRPELIHISISGYGSGGPYEQKKAYDLLVQCEAGLVSVTGTEQTPSKAGISVADIAAGMYAYTGALTALLQRGRTGEGATIEVSMLEALAEWMSFPMYYATYGGSDPKRTGASHAAIAPYGPVRVAGGERVFLGIQNEREWTRFCADVLGDAALAGDPRFVTNTLRSTHRDELTTAIESVTTALSAEELVDRLDEAQIANARLRTARGLAEHPQLAARDRWREVGSPVGPLRALLPPATFVGAEPAAMTDIPGVGEHTAAIRAELSRSADSPGDTRRIP